MSVVVWVDEAPNFRFEHGVVVVTIHSGDMSHDLTISRANFRRAVETGKRMLDAEEIAEQGRVAVLNCCGG